MAQIVVHKALPGTITEALTESPVHISRDEIQVHGMENQLLNAFENMNVGKDEHVNEIQHDNKYGAQAAATDHLHTTAQQAHEQTIEQNAQSACDQGKNSQYNENKMHVSSKRMRQQRQSSSSQNSSLSKLANDNIYCAGIPLNVTTAGLCEVFCEFGTISEARILMDKQNPLLSRGCGFVRYSDGAQPCKKAIAKWNGRNVNEWPNFDPSQAHALTLKVRFAVKKHESRTYSQAQLSLEPQKSISAPLRQLNAVYGQNMLHKIIQKEGIAAEYQSIPTPYFGENHSHMPLYRHTVAAQSNILNQHGPLMLEMSPPSLDNSPSFQSLKIHEQQQQQPISLLVSVPDNLADPREMIRILSMYFPLLGFQPSSDHRHCIVQIPLYAFDVAMMLNNHGISVQLVQHPSVLLFPQPMFVNVPE